MQASMWAVLCGTLGVAYAVSRSLSAPSGREVLVGPISLRLPDGFVIDKNPQATLQAHDSKKRVFLVVIEPSGRDDFGPEDKRNPIDFRGLNQTGGLTSQKRVVPTPNGDAAQTTFVASTNIPSLNQQVILALVVNEDSDDDDQSELKVDQVILQKIANSVTLRNGAPALKHDSSKDTVVFLQGKSIRGAKL
jgi:hypothetical protein